MCRFEYWYTHGYWYFCRVLRILPFLPQDWLPSLASLCSAPGDQPVWIVSVNLANWQRNQKQRQDRGQNIYSTLLSLHSPSTLIPAPIPQFFSAFPHHKMALIMALFPSLFRPRCSKMLCQRTGLSFVAFPLLVHNFVKIPVLSSPQVALFERASVS